MIVETFKNTKGQTVGALHHDKAYRTVRQQNKHLLLVMDAWGIDKSITYDLRDKCDVIRLLDTDEDVVYSIPLETMLEKGIEKNFGFGVQLFLPRPYWTAAPKQQSHE
jgi:hypothetical protein